MPAVKVKDVQLLPPAPEREVDILATLSTGGRPHRLICEVKANGQPRNVRIALLQLRSHLAHLGKDVTPLLIAPYLSPEAQALCRDQGVGFLDFEGNARIVFGGVFVDARCRTNLPPNDAN